MSAHHRELMFPLVQTAGVRKHAQTRRILADNVHCQARFLHADVDAIL
jgi:hypothetical protein